MVQSRLLVVSNRLPITIRRSSDGTFDFTKSSGGLVSGLRGLAKATKFHWYGWPGMEFSEDEQQSLKMRLFDEHDAIPVMMNDELVNSYYNGFSSMKHRAVN